jgi:hypothetical protein
MPRDAALDAQLKGELAGQISRGNYSFCQQGFRKALGEKERQVTRRVARVGHAWNIVAAWIRTPRREWLKRDWSQLTDECKMLLSLTDEPWFAEQVELQMGVPEWRQVLVHVLSPRFSDEDLRFCIEWSQRQAHAIPLLARVIYSYDLLYFTHSIHRDFTGYCTDDNATRFLYLFIDKPQFVPLFQRFIESKELPQETFATGLFWQRCHFYRAAIFHHLLNGRNEQADELMELMPSAVSYHCNGSPKPFINQTLKWAKQWKSPKTKPVSRLKKVKR